MTLKLELRFITGIASVCFGSGHGSGGGGVGSADMRLRRTLGRFAEWQVLESMSLSSLSMLALEVAVAVLEVTRMALGMELGMGRKMVNVAPTADVGGRYSRLKSCMPAFAPCPDLYLTLNTLLRVSTNI